MRGNRGYQHHLREGQGRGGKEGGGDDEKGRKGG